MRYFVLVLLNLPIILLAFVNILTQYKLEKISKTRFKFQLLWWAVILVVLLSSFPIYNVLNDMPVLDSSELTLFDIFQTTAIIYLLYILNYQRQKIEQNDRTLRELHQELSIKLSARSNDS